MDDKDKITETNAVAPTTPATEPSKEATPAAPESISKEAYDKDIADLRKNIESQSNLINAVYADPDIQNLIRTKYGSPETPPAPTPASTPSAPEAPTRPDPKIAEMDMSLRAKAITDFDERYGIKPEEAEQIHNKMSQELQALGQDVRSVDLSRLPDVLEKSFRLSHQDRYDNIAKSKGATATMNNLQAQVPTQGGGSTPNADGSVPLDEGQKDWINKLVPVESGKDAVAKAQEVAKKHPEATGN